MNASFLNTTPLVHEPGALLGARGHHRGGVAGMTHDEYASLPGVNWSTLKHMRDSPKAYRYACDNAQPDKEAFAIGRALHTMVLEPDLYDERFVIWDGGRRVGKEWCEFVESASGKTILRLEDDEHVRAMATAVSTHPVAASVMAHGMVERPMQWQDEGTGIECKARPDLVNTDERLLLDLKTTRSINGRRFGAEAARFGYSLQLAHYENGCRRALCWAPLRVLIVAVEKMPPHDVGVFEIDAIAREIAAAEVQALLRRLGECIDLGEWPGRYSEVQALELPAWVYADDDEDDANGFGLTFGGA